MRLIGSLELVATQYTGLLLLISTLSDDPYKEPSCLCRSNSRLLPL